MSVEVFYPVFYWVVYCFGIELHELFILEMNPLSVLGFPGSSVEKNLPASAGDTGLISGLRRSFVVGNGNPLQDSCLENFRRAW